MKVKVIAVGSKMPQWVETAVAEYSKRLPKDCALEVIEIAPGHRGKGTNKEVAMNQEAEAIRKALKPSDHIVTLEVLGQAWSTEKLAKQLEGWRYQGNDTALIVGGPDGLHPSILKLAKQRWSLSALTLPHPMVRIILAEQIYRAWTILQGHPYHK